MLFFFRKRIPTYRTIQEDIILTHNQVEEAPRPSQIDTQLERYFLTNRTKLERYAYSILHDRDLASMCVSETVLRAWKNRQHLDMERVGGWVYATLKRVAIDSKRKLKRTYAVFEETEEPNSEDSLINLIHMQTELENLSERDRRIILLRAKGSTLQEISADVGISKVACLKRIVQYKKIVGVTK